jgi:hypothetical protein
MSVVLCVTLWANPGHEDELVDYEDTVLALLPEHRSRLVARVRTEAGAGDGQKDAGGGQKDAGAGHPFETQIIEMADDAALESYMRDPRRVAASEVRDRAIARTKIQRVTLV